MPTNNNDIETIEIKLPHSGKTARARKRPTGADKEAILSVLLNAADITVDDNDKSSTKIDASSQITLIRLKLRRFLTEVEGQTGMPEELYELAIALDIDDYNAITKVINKVTEEIKAEDDEDSPKKKGTKNSTKN